MRKYMLTAAIVAVGLPLTPAMARQMDGYVVRSTVMRAGPDYDYPAVQRLRRDARVTVYGCLRDWNWCDVSNRYDRGWVPRQNIQAIYQGRRRYLSAYMGIGILSFTFGNYWDNNYRSRPFYSQRPRWEQHYNNNYRTEWGPRPLAPSLAPQQRQPGMDMQQGGRPQRQAAPERQIAPIAPQVAPQQHQPGAMQHHSAPAQQQSIPEGRGNPGRQAAPGSVNPGQHQAPDNQRGGQRGNSQDKPDKDHKSHD